ncbi:ABC transporter ATP-binding protein [Gilliamella apicola]|nr:ABC transporter ATP-binding protein [Gilliamella apicola]
MGKAFWISILTAIISTIMTLVPIGILYIMLRELTIATVPLELIYLCLLVAFIVMLFRWGLIVISHVSAHHGALKLAYNLKLHLTHKLGLAPLSFFSCHTASDLRKVINDDIAALEGFLAHFLPDVASALTLPIVGLTLLIYVDMSMAFATILLLPVAFWCQWLSMRRSTEQARQWGELQLDIAQKVSEYIRGIAVIKSFGLMADSFHELSQTIRGVAPWIENYCKKNMFGWNCFNCLLSSNLVLVAPIGAWRCFQGDLEPVDWLLCLLVAPVILQPFSRLVFAFSEQAQRQGSLDRLNQIVNASQMTVPDVIDKTSLPTGNLVLSFSLVSYRYEQQKPVLQEITFNTLPHGLTAIVGPSGAGKTTIARLATRLLDCDCGEITLGGLNIQHWPVEELFKQISMVSQNVYLFNATVKENLLLGRPDANNEQVIAATQAACAHEFILSLPQGYDTQIGENGARLSGGERQRLSIARALLRDAPLLILDEATAYADSENEWFIQQAISNLCNGRSVLMIAHRLKTIIQADQIIVVDKGKVVGHGRHDELLLNCPCYCQLWQDFELNGEKIDDH